MIQNYSEQTINSYRSGLNIFLRYVADPQVAEVDEELIRTYLNLCKTERKYSLSSMKLAYSAIRFLFIHVLQRPFPPSLRFTFRREEKLPADNTVPHPSGPS